MAAAAQQSPHQQATQQAADLRQQIELTKQKNKYLASPEGKRMIQDQTRASRPTCASSTATRPMPCEC